MTQVYSNPEREDDPYSLPDTEVFYMSEDDFRNADADTWMAEAVKETDAEDLAGWYWWPCFPGCLPDGDPVGPFECEQYAIDDIYETYG